jgi:hypothetical protein
VTFNRQWAHDEVQLETGLKRKVEVSDSQGQDDGDLAIMQTGVVEPSKFPGKGKHANDPNGKVCWAYRDGRHCRFLNSAKGCMNSHLGPVTPAEEKSKKQRTDKPSQKQQVATLKTALQTVLTQLSSSSSSSSSSSDGEFPEWSQT